MPAGETASYPYEDARASCKGATMGVSGLAAAAEPLRELARVGARVALEVRSGSKTARMDGEGAGYRLRALTDKVVVGCKPGDGAKLLEELGIETARFGVVEIRRGSGGSGGGSGGDGLTTVVFVATQSTVAATSAQGRRPARGVAAAPPQAVAAPDQEKPPGRLARVEAELRSRAAELVSTQVGAAADADPWACGAGQGQLSEARRATEAAEAEATAQRMRAEGLAASLQTAEAAAECAGAAAADAALQAVAARDYARQQAALHLKQSDFSFDLAQASQEKAACLEKLLSESFVVQLCVDLEVAQAEATAQRTRAEELAAALQTGEAAAAEAAQQATRDLERAHRDATTILTRAAAAEKRTAAAEKRAAAAEAARDAQRVRAEGLAASLQTTKAAAEGAGAAAAEAAQQATRDLEGARRDVATSRTHAAAAEKRAAAAEKHAAAAKERAAAAKVAQGSLVRILQGLQQQRQQHEQEKQFAPVPARPPVQGRPPRSRSTAKGGDEACDDEVAAVFSKGGGDLRGKRGASGCVTALVRDIDPSLRRGAGGKGSAPGPPTSL